MFGISPLGWVHTLGSLPAIPVAAYMLARHGRIVARSTAGAVYLASMLIGATTVFLVAHQGISYVIGGLTIVLLLVGFGLALARLPGRAAAIVETTTLSTSVFLLMLPTVTEVLRRVPDGHPIAADPASPVLLGAQAATLLLLVIGLSWQLFRLRRSPA